MKKINKPDTEIIKTFWWLFAVCIKHARWTSILYLVASMLRIIVNLFAYFATARMSALLVTILTTDDKSTTELRKWFILTALAGLVGYALYTFAEMMQKFVYYRLVKWVTKAYFIQLCSIDMADFYDNKIRNEMNRISSGVEWQIPNSATTVLNIIQSAINTVATVVTVGFVAWWLIPLFVVMMIPGFIYESKLARISWYIWDKEDDSRHIYWGIQSMLTQAKKQFEIRALTAQNRLLKITDGMNSKFYGQQEQEVHKLNPLAIISVVSQFLREAIGQAWLLMSAIAGKISLEQYFFYIGIIFKLDGAISGLFTMFARVQDGLKYSTDYRYFLRHAPKIVDHKNAQKVDYSTPPEIEFIDASFTYPGAASAVFSKLNLTIKAGQKIALVGENGAGKSTIIKLLMRFYYLDEGELLINGVNIKDISIDSWYKQVATLFQDFNQYPLTVSDNISISGDKTSQIDVVRAAKLAGSHDYIQDLPNSYDTYLDPAFKDGVEPSGGMWQRVGLARAFYRKASMLILDEPTSAIDAKAEYEIFNNIFSEHDGKTALIISHRFSTVRKADRIVVLEHGEVLEDGTHEVLLKNDGRYAEMFNKQAEGYR
jgi:ATP-binding cassette subfamily B protein